MNISTLQLKVDHFSLKSNKWLYDAREAMEVAENKASYRGKAFFYQSFVESVYKIQGQLSPVEEAGERSWSYDLDKDLFLLGTMRAQMCPGKPIHLDKCVPVTFPDWDSKGHVFDLGGYLAIHLRWFMPNHDPQEQEEWKRLFFGQRSSCPECKGTGKVALFQFNYACSLCGDGKRL